MAHPGETRPPPGFDDERYGLLLLLTLGLLLPLTLTRQGETSSGRSQHLLTFTMLPESGSQPETT